MGQDLCSLCRYLRPEMPEPERSQTKTLLVVENCSWIGCDDVKKALPAWLSERRPHGRAPFPTSVPACRSGNVCEETYRAYRSNGSSEALTWLLGACSKGSDCDGDGADLAITSSVARWQSNISLIAFAERSNRSFAIWRPLNSALTVSFFENSSTKLASFVFATRSVEVPKSRAVAVASQTGL